MNINHKNQAKVTLVGAGPGDVELITVKGLKAIQQADVILYDALVNPKLLDEAPPRALKIYVGKRANKHRYQQEEINLMLVQYAFQYGHVVRLKGGDSFVFGRGHEELEYIKAFGIPTAIVPGISSSIAVPELQEVPLTRRGINESFWVLTATTRQGKLAKDIYQVAQSSATAVILMGVKKLPQIVEIYKSFGRDQLPVLVTQNGSRANERFVLGTISTIAQKVKDEKIGAPAIILIGEVATLHPEWAQTAQFNALKETILANTKK